MTNRLKELERTRELLRLALEQWDNNPANGRAIEDARNEVLRTERAESQALQDLGNAVQRIGTENGIFSAGGYLVASKAFILRIEETIDADMEELVALGKVTESNFYQQASAIGSKMVYATPEYQPFATALGAARDATHAARIAFNAVREPRDALSREYRDVSEKIKCIGKAKVTRETRVQRQNVQAQMDTADSKRIDEAVQKLSGLIYGRVTLKEVA